MDVYLKAANGIWSHDSREDLDCPFIGIMSRAISLIVLVGCLALLIALGGPKEGSGPGMTVGYDSVFRDREISIESGTTSSGEMFTSGLSITPGYKNGVWPGAKFTGASTDERSLPEWIEFKWKEWPYPYPERPSDPEALEEWSRGIQEFAKATPVKILRVPVRSRVPQDVVSEAVAAALVRKPGELPEKRIWISFVWHPKGIWFKWRISTETATLRSGGDEIPWQPE